MTYWKATSLAHLLNQLRDLLNKKEYAILVALLVYLAIAVGLYPFVGGSIFAVSVLPAAVLGVHYGVRSGVVSGPACLLINWLLFILLGNHGSLGQFIAMGGLIGSIATATVGSGIGYVASLNSRLNVEVSRRKQAQQELNGLNQKLEHQTQQALQARAHFLTAMSHKLRTPLNASVGINTLLFDTDLDQTQSSYVYDLQRSNNEVIGIINSILEYTKVESGEIELNKVNFDLSTLLKQIQRLVQSRAEEQNVKQQIQIESSVPSHLVGDEKRLRLILQNLLINALNATPDGTVTLRVSLSPQHRRNIEPVQNKMTFVTFHVIDTGKGIDSQGLEGLFEPFGNSYQTTTQSGVGAGIGMALCKRLCQSMGGRIHAQSVLGKGTTITVTLPFERSKVPATSNSPRPNHDSSTSANRSQIGRQQKILLAEDNILNAKIALKLLEKLGYTAQWVKDGKEAVEAVTESTYDLILMDIQMPRLDGLEATKEIRKRYEKSGHSLDDPCIIALTADTTLEDFSKQQAYGFDGFIGKPMSVEVLKKALDDIQAVTH